MLSTNDLAARFGVSPATIFRWRAEGSLPAPLSLSKTTVRWREEDTSRLPVPSRLLQRLCVYVAACC